MINNRVISRSSFLCGIFSSQKLYDKYDGNYKHTTINNNRGILNKLARDAGDADGDKFGAADGDGTILELVVESLHVRYEAVPPYFVAFSWHSRSV